MDIASVVGIVLANVAMIWAVWLGGSFSIFIDVPSIVLVGGGTLASTMMKWTMNDLKSLATVYMKVFFNSMPNAKNTIDEIINRLEDDTLGDIMSHLTRFDSRNKGVSIQQDNGEVVSKVLGPSEKTVIHILSHYPTKCQITNIEIKGIFRTRRNTSTI